MATLHKKYLNTIIAFYVKEKLSARQIAEKYKVSIDAVYYFLRKYDIPRRTPQEQNLAHFENKPLSFSIKENLSSTERELFIAGLILYWCEGSRWEKEVSVDFANSNPTIIELFVKFLRKIFHINEKRLRCYLYCYSNQPVKTLINYWSGIAKIPRSQFTKPYVRQDFDLKKRDKMKYGLIHIRYSDKKLLQYIKYYIKILPKILNNPRAGTEAAKRGRLSNGSL